MIPKIEDIVIIALFKIQLVHLGYPVYNIHFLHLFLFTYNLQLTIRGDQFLENLFAILRFEADRNVAKLQKPVDKDKWATEPAVVNAFYNPNKNDIGKSYLLLLHHQFGTQKNESK